MSYPTSPDGPYGPPQGYGPPQQQTPPGYGYPPGGGIPGMPPYASWGARVGATLVDFLIVGLVPLILLTVGYVQFVSMLIDSVRECENSTTEVCSPTAEFSGSSLALFAAGTLLGLAGSLWLCYREGRTGQTPGKKALKITVLREADGRPLGFGMAFVRRIAHTLDGMACYIGYLWPLWDDKKQTFADKVMGTVVVKAP